MDLTQSLPKAHQYSMKLKKIWLSLVKHKLIYIGLVINILFYISAYQTKWFDYFFSGSSLHLCCRGLDFYQVPNGAYAYLHGGSLSGSLAPGVKAYSGEYYSNINVYHPLFTLLIGGLFTLFTAANSIYIWMLLKLCITLGLVIYFYRSFKGSRYIHFAIFVMLIDFTQYLEIRISQYQFLFNVFILLLLINLAKNKNAPIANGIYFLASLLVKPIGFLWFPLLFFKGQQKALLLGLLLFIVGTGIFVVNKTGDYYTHNLVGHFFAPYYTGPIEIITLDALLRSSVHVPEFVLGLLKMTFLGLTLFLSTLKRIHVVKSFYLTIVCYLLFFDLVYEYYYTSIVVVLAVCLVSCTDFQTKAARILITILSLPGVFFILHFFHVGFVQDQLLGPDPTFLGWQLMVLSRIIPLILLTVLVLWSDILLACRDLRRFYKVMRQVNKELEVFG
ncbi:MAG TPA: hypothetical protein VN954_12295 [Ktedonobacteraceae bacterium]|nr:hypothetical protein [Ktedonobacteraceae bacterium]